MDLSFFTDYEKVKDKVCYRLINQQKNADLLREIPSLPFLDLAICFFYPFEHSEIGSGSILIKNDHLERWEVSVRNLWRDANNNTRRLYPQQCCPMEEMLLEMAGKSRGQWDALPEGPIASGELPMKILTNHQRIFGAAVILYDNYLERLAEKWECSFYVLPSSIHEVIIFPKLEADEGETLQKIVEEVNATVLDPQEILSNNVYLYDRERKKIENVGEKTP